ncbi:MFS transporter [Glutamicibacter sp. NPDC087344]|uniref:MFS transporter n=1 Tax=Glutamicibacter sp. NPDC087344 TaxID=3363994 RepID=UPI003823A56A
MRSIHRDAFTALCLLVLVTAVGYIPAPMYPMYQELFGFSDLTLTLIYAAYATVSAPALLFFGPAADALGKRAVIQASIALCAAGALCFVLATGPGMLLLGRGLFGLAIAAATAGGMALIIERTEPAKLAVASVACTIAFVGGTVVGSFLAGMVGEFVPFPRFTPYIVFIGLMAIGWWRARRIDSPPVLALRDWRPVMPRIPANIRTRFMLASGASATSWFGVTLFVSIIPTLLARSTGINRPFLTGCVLAAMLACSMLTQLLGLRLSALTMQLCGLPLLLLGLLGLALTDGASLSITLVFAVLSGLGQGLAYSGAGVSIDQVTNLENRASVTSAYYLSGYLATGVPPIIVGVLTIWVPLGQALSWISWVGVVLGLLTFAGLLIMRRQQVKPGFFLTA